MRVSISTERRSAMDKTLPSAKSHAFPVGAKLTIVQKREGSFKDASGNELPNDKLEVKVTNAGEKDGSYLFPVREYLKAETAEGSEALMATEGGLEYFPASFEIVSATDRKDRNGKTIYPVQAYNAFEEQIEAGNGIDWEALVASDVKADNELSPVQNYTVTIG